MFATEKKRAEMITWVIRLGGFVLMWIGLMMLVRPLRVVADILPFAGSMVEFASGLVMLLVAGTVSLVTIAIAWLVYRPVLGIALLILAAGLVVLIVRKKKAHTATFPAMPMATNLSAAADSVMSDELNQSSDSDVGCASAHQMLLCPCKRLVC